MAQVTLPYTLTAGTPENVNNLVANLNALVAGVNTVDTAQLASGAVTTAKIADAGVTADKLGATLASQIGVSQTGTTRRVSVTASSEQSTTSTSGVAVTGSESSTLAVSDNGLLLVGFSCELKSSSASGFSSIIVQIDNNSSWLQISAAGTTLGYNGANWYVNSGLGGSVGGTTYRKLTSTGLLPSGINTSGNAKIRFYFVSDDVTRTAYVKNLTATMTYIAA